MSKLSAEAFVKIQELVDSGKIIQLEKHWNGYEITVFDNPAIPQSSHSHYNDKNLIKAIDKAKDH